MICQNPAGPRGVSWNKLQRKGGGGSGHKMGDKLYAPFAQDKESEAVNKRFHLSLGNISFLLVEVREETEKSVASGE